MKVNPCEKCYKYEAEFKSPGRWCRFCWGKWWFLEPREGEGGAKDVKGYKQYLKEEEEEHGKPVRCTKSGRIIRSVEETKNMHLDGY
jgi:hypothetical protein